MYHEDSVQRRASLWETNDSLRSDARREFSAADGIVTDHRGVVSGAPSPPCVPLSGLLDLEIERESNELGNPGRNLCQG